MGRLAFANHDHPLKTKNKPFLIEAAFSFQ